MILFRRAAALALAVTLGAIPAIASDEPDELMPGRIVLIRNGIVAKFVAKPAVVFNLPSASNDPTQEGASLRIFDTGGTASDTYGLPSQGWKALGNPAGSRGYRYRGTGSISDPCRVVLVKAKIVKAVCKGAGVSLATPFNGDVGIELAVGTDTKTYCARFGTPVRNDSTLLKARNAPAPGTCAESGTTTTTILTSTTVGTGISTSTSSSSTSSTIAGPCCGGMQYSSFISDGVGAANCGTVRDATGAEYTELKCGGMYVGGGECSITQPLATPDFLHWVVELTNCTGQIATVGPTTSTDTGTRLNCTEVGCFFGGPLTIPNSASTPTSACVIINVASPASGTMNCSSGDAAIDLPLDAHIYLTGDSLPFEPGIQPCPLCTGGTPGGVNSGTCQGGSNTGNQCTPANSMQNASYPTSHDCPPLLNLSIGSIPIALSLDSGTVKWTGTQAPNPSSPGQTRVFCGYCRDPNTTGFQQPFQQCWENGPVGPPCDAPFVCQQRNVGAFGPNGQAVKTINAVGEAAGSIIDGLPHAQKLVSVFCIPPTFNAAVDAAADLPGPAAVPLSGSRTLCSAANDCPP